jgi:signal transduction histidine kinase
MASAIDVDMLVKALATPLLVLDSDDVVMAVNTCGAAAFMSGSGNPRGKKFKDVARPSVHAALASARAEASLDGRPRVVAMPALDARTPAAASVNVIPLRRDDGTVAGIVVMAHEGSADQLLSEQLRASNAELEAANEELAVRVEELRHARDRDDERTRFLPMLAHELRNPLAAIKNALHVLRRRMPAPADRLVDQAMRIAERQTASQARLLDDLLDISRIVLGKITLRLEPTDIVAITRHALDAAEYAIRARAHTLRAHLPDHPVTVMGDPVRLDQIVANLIHNAVKYTPPAGEITVVVSATTDSATLTVTDTGIGMETELLARVFDMFAQGETSRTRAAGGLGIGLTVVRQLAELHGGTIDARSAGTGKGSTFRVRLPRTDATPAVESASPSVRHPRRILIVDDNRDAREMLRTVLELDGHRVNDSADAATAVRLAVEWMPEVVLLDIGLPDVDGYEIARRIRKRVGTAVRLIAVTGYGDPAARHLAVEAGFDELLVKPLDPDRLSDLLDNR